jgi:hypothetical protein
MYKGMYKSVHKIELKSSPKRRVDELREVHEETSSIICNGYMTPGAGIAQWYGAVLRAGR